MNEDIIKIAQHGDTAALIELVAEGADVNAKGEYSGWKPLMLAAREGQTDKMKVLLAQGADTNMKSTIRRRTALMEAIRHRKLDAVEVLLAGDCDVDAVDWEGHTGLMFAAISGQIEIVKVLLRHGADANMKNRFEASTLKMAADYPDIVRLLEEAGSSK